MNRRRSRAFCVLVLLVCGAAACLPEPMSVKEKRQNFERNSLRGRILFEAPPPGMHPVNAVFGGRIKLVGWSMDPTVPKRGDTVEVTFYWSALKLVNEDYMIFVHGDALDGQARRIHIDHYPAKGQYSMDLWQEGEIVADRFFVPIDHQYGPKRLGIYAGLYLNDYRVPLTEKGEAPADAENRSMPIEIPLP